jgi:hypothetical protein
MSSHDLNDNVFSAINRGTVRFDFLAAMTAMSTDNADF